MRPPALARGWAAGIWALAFADYDSDGDPDLYLTRWGRDVLLANETETDATFKDATAAAGLGSAGWGIGSAFADYDRDGDLDLYVANYITYQRGGAALLRPLVQAQRRTRGLWPERRPSSAGLALPQRRRRDLYRRQPTSGRFAARITTAMGVAWSDLDGDGDPDLYVANDGHPNSLYRNDGGRFINISLATSTAYSGDGRAQAGMGVALADFDNDLQVDVFVTNFSQDQNTLYRNEGQWILH